MANLSDAFGGIRLGQIWPRRTIVALAYVLTVGYGGGDYGIWNSINTLENANALPRGEFKFDGCGRWTISNTLEDMFLNFKGWVKDTNYGTGRLITGKEMLVMYEILVKDMLEADLHFTINYVDYEPGNGRLVSGMMKFKSNGTKVFVAHDGEGELPYTMRTMIKEFGWDEDRVLDAIDSATCDMDLSRIDRRDFFNDILKAIMDTEADNLQPEPYWVGEDIPEFVLNILEKHLERF